MSQTKPFIKRPSKPSKPAVVTTRTIKIVRQPSRPKKPSNVVTKSADPKK